MRLPVSGIEVAFRAPDGHDDLAILESRTASPHRRRRTGSSAPSTPSLVSRSRNAPI